MSFLAPPAIFLVPTILFLVPVLCSGTVRLLTLPEKNLAPKCSAAEQRNEKWIARCSKGKIILMMLLLIFTGLILHPLTAAAQSETEDVIYLKNGGILRGEILEIVNNEIIRIKTAGRNVFVVEMTEVDTITEEQLPSKKYYKVSGYINHSGVDLLSGSDTLTPYFYTMNGYRFNPRFAAGIGVGYIPYRDPLDLFPLYLQMSVNLTEANISPFLFLKTGYNFSVESGENNLVEIAEHKGGWMINPGMGIEFNLKGGFRWYLNAGYSVNNAVFEEDGFGQTTIENDLSYRRVLFGIGFSF